MDEVEDAPDEKDYVGPKNAKTNMQPRNSTMQRQWKPIDTNATSAQKMPDQITAKASGSDLKNKFATQPNKYVYNKPDQYKQNIYKGLNTQFWNGVKASEQGKFVVDFVEFGIQHRISFGDPFERAFSTPEQVEDYYNNDKIFKQCPMNPRFQPEPWTLRLVGGEPRIKQ